MLRNKLRSRAHIFTFLCDYCQLFFFFSIWVFFHNHPRITGLQGKGEDISLTPHNHFHPLHRHLDISRPITTESSPLHIGSCRNRTGNLWFPSASRYPLSYARALRVSVFSFFCQNASKTGSNCAIISCNLSKKQLGKYRVA